MADAFFIYKKQSFIQDMVAQRQKNLKTNKLEIKDENMMQYYKEHHGKQSN